MDGPSIAKKHRDRALKIFQRLRARGDEAHIGLGLALVRRILQMVGGELRLDEVSEDRGLRVTFTWPSDWPLGDVTETQG